MKRPWLIVFGDFASFLIAFLLLIFIRFNQNEYLFAVDSHLLPFTILYLSWVLVFYVFGLYDLFTIKPTIPYLNRWIFALLCSFGVGIILFYFVPIFGISPKINLVIQVIGFGFFSFLFRRMIYNLFSKMVTRPAILVGNSPYLTELSNTISTNPQTGLRVLTHLKTLNNLTKDQEDIKNLIIILDKEAETSDENILNLYKKGVEIIDVTKAYETYLQKIPVGYISSAWIVDNIHKDEDFMYKTIRRIVDIISALLIIVIFSPFVLVAIIAKLIEDGRPIFIKQKRVGLNGKVFELYKMRSMIVLSPDGSAETDNNVKWAENEDPRITPVGRILRKTHIDEIPQMINILKGDITLVGPRPERPQFVSLLENTVPNYRLRHIINPGFTGWAQIKYRYARTAEDSKEKLAYDLYYIKNRNILIDLGIILRTIQIIFTH